MPFYALWLAWLGFTPDDIGLLIGAGVMARFVANIFITPRFHLPEYYLFGLRLLTTSSFCIALFFFIATYNFWWLLFLTIALNMALGATIPIADAMTSAYHQINQLDYGKVRLWGSISFMLASTVAGALMESFSASIFVWLFTIPLLLCVFWSQSSPSLPAQQQTEAKRPSLIRVFCTKKVLVFLAIVSCIQSSHAAYYAFSAIYWTESGISDMWVGYLWSIGVLVEIGIFAISRKWFGHWSVVNLLRFAALGVMLRWVTIGVTTELGALVLAQGLHGVTFGIAHIAAIRFIQEQKQGQAVALQALYYALPLGAMMALMTMVSGELYQFMQANTFILMALGGVLALVLSIFFPVSTSVQQESETQAVKMK